MKNVIPIIMPWMGDEEATAVRETILSGWITQGPRVKAFEEAFASAVGASHACAVSSCTAALHLALQAVGVKRGDVVITVSYSFVATANAIRHCGAEPYFVDVEAGTRNLDPGVLEATFAGAFEKKGSSLMLRNPASLARGESPLVGCGAPIGRLGALLVVHQAGMPADMARIMDIAGRHGVPVVEDAACAIGSEMSLDGGAAWESVGRPRGEIACFSFHPRKVISTGDGGMLTTTNVEYDRKFRLLRQHGMGVSDQVRHDSERVIFEDYVTTGYNYRMTDVQAALGIEQLKRLPAMVARRRKLAARYREALGGIRGLKVSPEPLYARTNWQTFIVDLAEPARQREVMQALLDRGISTRRAIMCAHREKPYSNIWPAGSLPESEAACDRGLALPLYHQLSEADQDRVIDGLRAVVSP